MRSTSTSRRRNEEGMALLFALGFLAMLLVLGLGFVTTSLLSQKIAVNNATRVQARMLARSAGARAALAIMLYNDQSIVNDVAVSSYDGVCSYDQVKYNSGDNNEVTGAINDQLKKGTGTNAAESILKYSDDDSEITGEKSNAKWIYFYDSPSGTQGRKIIGRVAFQVLPSSTQWLSLYGVSGGAKLKNDLGVIPYSFRWGRGVEELCLNTTATLAQWSNYAIETKIPFAYDTLYNTYSDFFTTDADDKKSWIESWFVEGRNSVIKEAFPVSDPSDPKKVSYYNRFNIGDRYYDATDRNDANKDNWYDRFKAPAGGAGWSGDISAKKNSADALTALTAEAVPYQENDADDTLLDAAGLPFLKRIGNDPYSFESLELLRKQIAANFNDYCDADSIPTSDIKSSEWSITDPAKFPKYTGNEKTLYINEVAGIICPVKLKCVQNGDGQHVPVTVTEAGVKFFLELVNMYDRSDDPPLLNPANLEALMAVKKLSFNIAIRAKYTGKVTYTTNSGAQTHTANFTVTVNDTYNDDNFAAKVDYAPASPVAQTVSFSTLADGYAIGGGTAIQLQNYITDAAADGFTNAVRAGAQEAVPSDGTMTKYEITEVEASYQLQSKEGESKLELAPILLRAKNAHTGVIGAKNGVDFVRFDLAGDEGKMDLGGSPAAVAARKINKRGGWSTTFKDSFLIGGIEAIDPRQNLNPRSGTAAKSDWQLDPKLLSTADWESQKLPSMTVSTVSTSSATHDISAGLVNSNSNPKRAKGAPEDRDVKFADKELATDPAWRDDASGQHVSTAHIRNSPMVSPWEVGLIHRGRAWQTLNIKRAGGFGDNAEIRLSAIKEKFDNWSDPGTTYENGDGAILEYIKMSTACRAMGKIPLTMLRSEVITKPSSGTADGIWNGVKTEYNKDLVKMLFDGVRRGQTVKEFFAESKFGVTNPVAQGGTAVTTGDTVVTNFIKEIDDMLADSSSELRLRCQFLNSDYGANDGDSAFTFGLVTTPNTDAVREELIGKTINLLAVAEKTPPNIFRVVVVAQTIRDIGGIGSDVPITKLHNGAKTELKCQLGRFDFISDAADWEKNTYFDEITGEAKALITIERVPALDDTGAQNSKYGRLVISKIEYID